MTTQQSINKLAQQKNKLERKLAISKIKVRKQETRRKIQYGGLVVKSGMDIYPKDIILGALLDAYQQIENDEGQQALYQAKGECAFMNYGD